MPNLGRYTSILVDGYDLSGVSNSLQINAANSKLDVTAFQATGRQFLQEPTEASIAHAGYMGGGAAGEIEQVLYTKLGAGAAYVTALLNTIEADCPAYTAPATQNSEFQVQSPVTGVVTISGKWLAGTGLKHGRRVFGGAIFSTGAQTHIDLGAAGLTGGYAYLHVTAYNVAPSGATITVQSDDNAGFSSPTTHGTFTFSGFGAAEMLIVGTIDRYIRLNATSMGGSISFIVTGVIAVNGVTM